MTVRVIAEYGQTMKGSIDTAHAQVDAAAGAGAWAYKTQLLTPDRIAAPDAARYWSHGTPGTQVEAFTRAGVIGYGAWTEVVEHCADVGLVFVASPFDLEAVAALVEFADRGPVALKVASGDLTNVPLLRACAATGLPLIVSTGAATSAEVDRAHSLVWDDPAAQPTRTRPVPGVPAVSWLACSLVYPCPPEAANVARVRTLRGMIRDPLEWVGYSDHVGTPLSAVCAVGAGARLLEVHATLDPGDGAVCADDAMALDPERLAGYVAAAEGAALVCGSAALAPSEAEGPALVGARRSLWWAVDLAPGVVVRADHLDVLRPGDAGVPASRWDDVVGSVTAAAVRAGRPVADDELST